MAKFEENAAALGLDTAADPKGAEYDLVTNLLAAADFRNTENAITEVEIRRGGKFYFSVHVKPICEDEIRLARKKATSFMRNPQGVKYPPIEKDFNSSLFSSWLIYLATTPADQEKIWGNSAVKDKFGLMENVESIDTLLLFGEKTALADKIIEISGMDTEEPFDAEDFAKKVIDGTELGFLLHTIFQNQGIEPGIIMGLRTHYDPVPAGERAFLLASTRKAVEEGGTPIKIGNFAKQKGSTK